MLEAVPRGTTATERRRGVAPALTGPTRDRAQPAAQPAADAQRQRVRRRHGRRAPGQKRSFVRIDARRTSRKRTSGASARSQQEVFGGERPRAAPRRPKRHAASSPSRPALPRDSARAPRGVAGRTRSAPRPGARRAGELIAPPSLVTHRASRRRGSVEEAGAQRQPRLEARPVRRPAPGRPRRAVGRASGSAATQSSARTAGRTTSRAMARQRFSTSAIPGAVRRRLSGLGLSDKSRACTSGERSRGASERVEQQSRGRTSRRGRRRGGRGRSPLAPACAAAAAARCQSGSSLGHAEGDRTRSAARGSLGPPPPPRGG